MRLLSALASGLALCLGHVAAQHVSAHFMVGNTGLFGVADWRKEISLAQAAGIDSFALNMANNEATTNSSLPLAFDAADALGFKLFFSFDYAGNGPWPKHTVVSMINTYKTRPSYLYRSSQPLVSTFEGPEKGFEWQGSDGIKALTNCFFIPDWSSIGARPAMDTGIPDGLFSWDAWPKGPDNMTTYPDASYKQFLNGKPYMMPISPWFYTNMRGFDKNWLWNGDNLWWQRWQQILSLDFHPEYLQIITWNDYGESHYIGPLDDRQYEAFPRGRAPYNYVEGMPHDGWREFLPYIISLWKTGTASITQEGVVAHYRRHPHGACPDGTTTGNTANQLQLEFNPSDVLKDRVFYTALLTSPAQVTVTIGGVTQQGGWDQEPYGGVGLYYGSVPMNGATGGVVVTIRRAGAAIATVDNGPTITRNCPTGLSNFNPWVGSARGPTIGAVSPPRNLATLQCVEGFGVYEFEACVCLKLGVATPPPPTKPRGYPLPNKSGSFMGLCSFACEHDYCPETICSYAPSDGVVLNYSPFLPPACTKGKGPPGAFEGLCDFSCHYGFCPKHICECTQTGTLVDRPPKNNGKGYFLDKSIDDRGLCNFACGHGWCPDVCGNSTAVRDRTTTLTLAPAIWGAPTAQCQPPCILVLPSSTLSTRTTISIPPYRTSLEIGWMTTTNVGGSVRTVYTATTVTTTITVPAITTSVIGFSNVFVTATRNVPSTIMGIPSVSPPPFVITPVRPPGVTATLEPRTIRPPPWPFGQPEDEEDDEDEGDEGLLPYPFWPGDLPVFPELPTRTVSWYTDFVPEATTTDVQGTPVPIIPCWVWFIWFCPPKIGGIVLHGFRGPGIFPAGGPPPLPAWPGPGPPPPKIPWPEITIGSNNLPTWSNTPDNSQCTKATATIITTTTSYGISVVNRRRAVETPPPLEVRVPFTEFHVLDKRQSRSTTTYTIKTESFSTRVTGCGASDITKTTTASDVSQATAHPHIVIPKDPQSFANSNVNIMLASQNINNFYESKTNALGTIFWFIPSYTAAQADQMRGVGAVFEVYVPKGSLTTGYHPALGGDIFATDDSHDQVHAVEPRPKSVKPRKTKDQSPAPRSPLLSKRAAVTQPEARTEVALLSWGPSKGTLRVGIPDDYVYDDTAGADTFLYNLDFGIKPSHPEFAGLAIEYLYPAPNPVSSVRENDQKRHGTKCMSKAVGKTVGVARRTTLVQTVINFDVYIMDMFLDGLLKMHEDIRAKGRGRKAVLNISQSSRPGAADAGWVRMLAYLLRRIIELDVAVVTGAGNVELRPGVEQAPYGWPARFGDPGSPDHIPQLIVVSSCEQNGMIAWNGALAPYVHVFAPGRGIKVAVNDDNPLSSGYSTAGGGTSMSSATVAGLAAYYRGIFPFLDTAAKVKQEIVAKSFQRKGSDTIRGYDGELTYPQHLFQRNVVWNGILADGGTCTAPTAATRRRRDAEDNAGMEMEVHTRGVHGVHKRQQSGGSCALPPKPSPVTLRPTGTPGPVCAAGSLGCGQRCRGFFCQDSPLTTNPDFLDPRNPDSVQNPASPKYGDWDGPEPVSPIPAGQTSMRLALAYDMGHPMSSGAKLWWFMRGRVEGREIDLCNEPQLEVWSASDDIDPLNPPLPPPVIHGDFEDDSFPDYGRCSFIAPSGGNAGMVECEHTGRFSCRRDDSPYIQCKEDDYYGADKIKPVLRCDFPAIG
ncbi:hypothetical protein OQA88_8752 [Cercophora sp. LCS_1]